MKYEKIYQSRTNELNANDFLKPTQLVQYLQETAEYQITELDLDYIDLYNIRRKAFVVSRMAVEIYRPVYRYAKLTAHTWVTEGRAANFPRAYELECDGELVARSLSNWALLDVDTKKLVLYKNYDCSAYPTDEPPEMRIPLRFRIPKDIELKPAGTVRVGYSITDINRHLNNTHYYNMLHDCIPDVEKYDLTSMNLRFIHEAPYGETVEIFMSDILWRAGNEELVGALDPAAEGVVFFSTKAGENANVEAVYGLVKHA